MKRTAFFISDGTGITAEHLGNSLLAQFDNVTFEKVTLSYVNNIDSAREAVHQINRAYQTDGERPLLFDTSVDREIREILSSSKGFMIDIFGTFVSPLERELGLVSSYKVGQTHSIIDDNKYKIRMESIQFAMDNDDGARTRHYESADIIIVGVSRSGKTPTCIYLAMQLGIRAANYPLTEEDLDDLVLPKLLKPYKKKLFGLTIEPERLANIRNERKANSRYASLRQCEMEIRGVEALYARENIPYLNSTHLSVEEISTKLVAGGYIQRRT